MRRRQSGVTYSLLAVLVVVVFVVVGSYFFLFNKKALIDKAIRPDTSSQQTLKDKLVPRSKIKESGYNMKVVVEPSMNNVVSGTVSITAEQVSPEAAGVGFFISTDEKSFKQEGLPNISMDDVGSDGWSTALDTTTYANGKYFISIIAYPESGEGNPLGVAQIPVEIMN